MRGLKKIQYGLLASFASILAITNAFALQPYLDDANKSYQPAGSEPSIAQHEYPRVVMHEDHGNISSEAMSKYMLVSAPGASFGKMSSVQSNYSPDTMLLRHISGRAYQSFTAKPCYINLGVAFEGTGPVSQGGPSSAGCNLYAGHFLYRAGTTLTQSVNASALTLNVADASKFRTEGYVVIYNAPAGSFNNAEHARIQSRDLQNNTITLFSRGFKSNASSHASGSIVAQHVQGQAPALELWAFNYSSQSPRDGNNKTFVEFFSDWLKINIARTKTGETTTAKVAGLMFDADFYFDLKALNTDHNNDLQVDHGVSASGVNWLGEGLDTFYSLVRQNLPNHYILGGVHDARGYDSLNGGEMENWLDYGNGDFRGDPQYRILNSMFAHYLYHMSESAWAPLGHNTTKTATRLYPGIANPVPTSNAPVRLALAMTLMDNGYFGTHSRYTPDAWWDEYAVDVTPGSASYGHAINKNDVNGIHQHRGWLGQPLAPFQRVYNDNDFAATKSLLVNSTFDSSINSWSGNNVSISRVATGQFEGSGALRASPMTGYQLNASAAGIRSEGINVVQGQQYTVAFSARASREREIHVSLGWSSRPQAIPVSTSWRRYVVSFIASKTENAKLFFNVGREDSAVWLDSVYLFNGNANVFRRNFTNGIVLANATPTSRTIALGGSFQRILGTQDSAINNGQVVTSVTLPPYDGVLLVRLDGSSPPPPTGTARMGDFVWDDTNSDGIQNIGESGLAGVSVELQTCQGTTLASTVTDGNGAYVFNSLVAGSYRIRFIAPQGASLSLKGQGGSIEFDSNADPTTGLSDCYTLTDNQDRFWIDAGIIQPPPSPTGLATIGDFVWHDADGNGLQGRNESGLSGVTVQLLDCQGGILDATVTDANGAYGFTDLAIGNYQIQFIAPPGGSFSPAGQGASIEFDSNPDPVTGLTDCYSMSDVQTRVWIDAGIMLAAPPTGKASIGDLVWRDTNKNGIQDNNESGLAGVTVQLRTCQGAILDSTLTNKSGSYKFSALAVGDYKIKFLAPPGSSFSPTGKGPSIEFDSNADPLTGLTICYPMAENQERAWIDAGILY